jgi:hypothetical protein
MVSFALSRHVNTSIIAINKALSFNFMVLGVGLLKRIRCQLFLKLTGNLILIGGFSFLTCPLKKVANCQMKPESCREIATQVSKLAFPEAMALQIGLGVCAMSRINNPLFIGNRHQSSSRI